jgi:hypothetical protein
MNMKNDGIHVTDWGHCGFLGSDVLRENDGEKKKSHFTLRFENNQPPDSVSIAISKKPGQLLVNNGPIPLTDVQYENGILTIKLRRPGPNSISFAH